MVFLPLSVLLLLGLARAPSFATARVTLRPVTPPFVPNTQYNADIFAVAQDSNDRPLLAYVNASNPRMMWMTACDDPACSSRFTSTMVDTNRSSNGFCRVVTAFDDADGAVVSYTDVANGDLKIGWCMQVAGANDNLVCPEKLPFQFVSGSGLEYACMRDIALTVTSRYTDPALKPTAVLAYMNARSPAGGDLVVASCPMGGSCVETIYDPNVLGDVVNNQITVIALASSSVPVVVYCGNGGMGCLEVRVAAFVRPPFGPKTVVNTVFNTTALGLYNIQLAIRSDDCPVIYLQFLYGPGVLIVCSDPYCSAFTSSTISSLPCALSLAMDAPLLACHFAGQDRSVPYITMMQLCAPNAPGCQPANSTFPLSQFAFGQAMPTAIMGRGLTPNIFFYSRTFASDLGIWLLSCRDPLCMS
jgi:hypothetical protein